MVTAVYEYEYVNVARTYGWCYSIAHEAEPLVELSNTSLEWFIVKYHNNLCSNFYHAWWI